MAAENSDWYFTNGGSIEELRAQAMQVKQGAAGFGRQLRVGANTFIIARGTEAEAREVHAEIVAKADPSAVAGFAEAVKQAGQSTADGIGNWAKSGRRAGWIVLIAGALIGSAIGLYAARTVQMTAMPQLVSAFNSVGGGAAALVAIYGYLRGRVQGGRRARHHHRVHRCWTC